MDSRIQTYTGRMVDPFAMRTEDIDIRDIAHHLSLRMRFSGATKEGYSVAQHSVHVARMCSPVSKLWGLLHDASEAYIPDFPRPYKECISFNGVCVAVVESRILHRVAERFDMPYLIPSEVHNADRKACATERRDLMASPHDWGEIDRIPTDGMAIVPLSPREAEVQFLHTFKLLMGSNV